MNAPLPEIAVIDENKKSESAFRTIGEVSAELGLPTHVLRFWESKFVQIKPHKRRGGHRYYRPVDVEILREVKKLLYEKGFTIKGAQKYLKDIKKDKAIDQSNLFSGINDNAKTVAPKPEAKPDDKALLRKILNELIEVRSLLDQE